MSGALDLFESPGGVSVDRVSRVVDRGASRALLRNGGSKATKAMRPLSSNLSDEEKRPYFLWDEDVSLREFKERLRGPDPNDRLHLLAKLMREAKDTDVWMFITPQEAAMHFLVSPESSGGDRPSGIS